MQITRRSKKNKSLLETNPYVKLLFDWKLQLIKLKFGSPKYELLFKCIGELGNIAFDTKDYWQASFEAVNKLDSNQKAYRKDLDKWR